MNIKVRSEILDTIHLTESNELTFEDIRLLTGPNNNHLKMLEELLELSITIRGSDLIFEGSVKNRELFKKVIHNIIPIIKRNQAIEAQDIIYICNLVKEEKEHLMDEIDFSTIVRTYDGKSITAKTHGQYKLIHAMKSKDIVFSIGPAGTGKTYLAVAYAASLLKREEIKKIVLTRPAVEAGESLGFLPGDLKEKVDPYLQPLYDALNEIFGSEQVLKYMEKGVIEIAPLAYMRGRTLNHSFVILDEAQNATSGQIKMFLTRLGFQSKMLINGDVTQIDLRNQESSGLKGTYELLKDIKEISFIYLSSRDVVRHPLVQKIIEAYEKNDK